MSQTLRCPPNSVNFKFMLAAIDNGWGNDKFHIKIWDDNGVVYDNKSSSGDGDYDGTLISGGNIRVKRK